MKKDKKKIGEALLEALGELVLMLIFFGIGILIMGLFGVELDSSGLDDELIILIGIIACAVIFAIIWIAVQWIKKIIRIKRN
ncbi:MAG: hypothetical protein IKL59_02510 [Clostridia bacterium]|nr:hypothetical protein [Clostridia bacterium]